MSKTYAELSADVRKLSELADQIIENNKVILEILIDSHDKLKMLVKNYG